MWGLVSNSTKVAHTLNGKRYHRSRMLNTMVAVVIITYTVSRQRITLTARTIHALIPDGIFTIGCHCQTYKDAGNITFKMDGIDDVQQ